MKINTTPVPICPICSLPGHYLYEDLADNLSFIPGKWSMRKCTNSACGAIWLDPRPIDDDLPKAYSTYYTHDAKRTYKTLKYLISFSLKIYQTIVLNERPKNIYTIIDQYLFGTDQSLLDIGCGNGKLLKKYADKGLTVLGIDFDDQAIEAAKKEGLNVRKALVEDLRSCGQKYDFIILNHVIEHLADPVQTLRYCKHILKKGGVIIVATPNANSYGHYHYQRYWRGLEPPRHLVIFTDQSLRIILTKAGMRVVECVSTTDSSYGIITASELQKARNFSFIKKTIMNIKALFVLSAAIKAWKKNHMEGDEIICVIQADIN